VSAQERLWVALKRLSDAAPVELAPLIDDVSEAADAIRVDERRAIATWLIEEGGMLSLANAIVRGEHGS